MCDAACVFTRTSFDLRTCEIKFYGTFVLNRRVDLHVIDATPARWRGDAVSSPLDRARMSASSPGNDLVKNCRVHPDALVDFHTDLDRAELLEEGLVAVAIETVAASPIIPPLW